MALTYLNMTEVGTDAFVQINPRYVVYCLQKDDGIEVGLSTGAVLQVKGDWTKITMHFRDALAVSAPLPPGFSGEQGPDDGMPVVNP